MFNWFKKKEVVDPSETIKEELKKLQDKYFAEFAEIKNENFRLKNQISVLERSNEEFKSKLREQNEADTLLQCKRIEKKILDGEKKEQLNPELQHLAALQKAAMNYQPGTGNLARALGLSGLGL